MISGKKTLALTGAAIALLVSSLPASADLSCSFEMGLGKNGQAILSDIPGFVFTSTSGSGMRYADINSGWYSVTSDNGKVHEDGNYFISGDVAAYVTDTWDVGKIIFANSTASYLTLGYSSEFPLIVEAYSAAGVLLSSANGAVNSKASGGTGLSYLTVVGQDISYVLLKGTGGYWMVDNVTTDAVVPEPCSIIALGAGLLGIIIRRRS